VLSRILVAVDASPRAPVVFDHAAELARRFAAELQALRVVTLPPEFPAAGAGAAPDPLLAPGMDQARHELSALAERAPDLVVSPLTVRVGQPWAVILEAAEESRANLIVIGSHGYGGWDRVFGTTAGKIANLSTRSVLVVHQGPSGGFSGEAGKVYGT
jgi:nucleotide-binding universal stress UspA family protein